MEEKDITQLIRMAVCAKLLELSNILDGIDDIAKTAIAGFSALIINEDYVLVDFIEWTIHKIHAIDAEKRKVDDQDTMYQEALDELEKLKELI